MKKINVILMVLGSISSFTGLCVLLNAMFGPGAQKNLAEIAVGGMLFSIGCLLMSGGFYLSSLKLTSPAATVKGKSTVSAKKFKVGNCALCKLEPAIVRCMTHAVPVCSNCLMKHDNGKNCEYLPNLRKGI